MFWSCLDRDDPVDMTELTNKFGIDPEIDPDVGIPVWKTNVISCIGF